MRSDEDLHEFIRGLAFLLAATTAIVVTLVIGVLVLTVRAVVGGA